MLKANVFLDQLKQNGIDRFFGVPDSLLKPLNAALSERGGDTIAISEGNAMALATGYHLATGKVPLVYLQNSGLGNIVNPLLSLCDPEVYNIPLLIVIGWRGMPGHYDEPQHRKQGRVNEAMLKAMEVPFAILPNEAEKAKTLLQKVLDDLKSNPKPMALLVPPNTFEAYHNNTSQKEKAVYSSREEALEALLEFLPVNSRIFCTTGKSSRELFELRERRKEGHAHDFLTVGSMGHASQIALAFAEESSHIPVVCIDGDGALLMHMGGMALIGQSKAANLFHILINNEAHESVGGQPTIAGKIVLPAIAKAVGYATAYVVDEMEMLKKVLQNCKSDNGPHFIEIKVKQGSRKDLGRPTTSPLENKEAFMKGLNRIPQT